MELKHQGYSAVDGLNQAGRKIITISRISDKAIMGVVDLQNAFDYLIGDHDAVMTLNAVVTIAKFVSDKVAGVNYKVPTDLKGTPDDYALIVPDSVIAGVALLQAASGRSIDGQPGPSFLRHIMNVGVRVTDPTERLLRFMNEITNTTRKDAKGNLVLPDLDSAESVLYDYFRRITLVRNGLWSDRPGVANLTGIRRRKAGTPGKGNTWNDNLIVCWIDRDSNGRSVQRAKVFTGTTEPGNTANDPTVPPQTYIVRLGYHHAQQPGGRGFRIMARDAENVNLRFDRTDWRGINFHSGGSTGRPVNFKKGALPFGSAITEAQRKKNLALVEIYAILTRNGLNPAQTALDQIKSAAAVELVTVSAADNTIVTIQKKTGSTVQSKNINIAGSRKWIAEFWINKNQRDTITRILKSVDPGFKPPANFKNLSAAAVSNLIKASHVADIVRKQAAFLSELKDVDGLPGQQFIDILDGKLPDQLAAKTAAQTDLARFNDLTTGSLLTADEKTYVRSLIFNTTAERSAIETGKLEDPLDFSGFAIDESIGTWSVACQVVFGCEQFYKYWRYVTSRVNETGQMQWYYTVLDIVTLT